MLKKKIEYVDYNGNTRVEDFYFNFTKTELMEIQFSEAQGFDEFLREIKDSENLGSALNVIRYLVLSAYGEKSDDGRHFNKSDAISASFYNSPAYEALIEEFLTNETATFEFFKAVIPKDVAANLNNPDVLAKLN